jgi:hypothetical protein
VQIPEEFRGAPEHPGRRRIGIHQPPRLEIRGQNALGAAFKKDPVSCFGFAQFTGPFFHQLLKAHAVLLQILVRLPERVSFLAQEVLRLRDLEHGSGLRRQLGPVDGLG